MSATEQMRAMLDGLMGTARDGSDSQRQHLHFTDSRVCRAFLLDCCPHDIFASTKLELGECQKVHDPALRADYILANKAEDYMYEISALERLQSFVNEADKKTEYLKRKLAETQEELTVEETNKLNRVHDLTEKLGKKLAQVDKAEADGDLEAKQKLIDESEKIKKERSLAEAEYRKVSRPASSHQQQNLRVCDICSAYLGINDNDSRLADHFGGKLHLGFITVREKLEDLKKIATAKRASCKRTGASAVPNDRSTNRGRALDKERDYDYDYDRTARDRERDYDRGRSRDYTDRYRGDRDYDRSDRYRDRARDARYRGSDRDRDRDRDRERDRSRSSSRYYPSGRDSRPRDRYRDDRSDRNSDRIDRSERHDSIISSRSGGRGAFDRSETRNQERDLSYQRRLRDWEKREADKARKYTIRQSEERERKLLEEQESRKLKEFLEDYKDDRDDVRFYQGSALARRLADRRKEIDRDEMCRQKEKMELEILSRSCAAQDSSPQQIKCANETTTTQPNGDYAKIPVVTEEEAPSKSEPVQEVKPSTTSTTATTTGPTKGSSSEDKKKLVEDLISRIPTDKDKLFETQVDWSMLSDSLLNNRIRQWLERKIADLLGEETEDVIEFVVGLLKSHTGVTGILAEVGFILADTDSAQKFTMHLWRLLIFETEAKKIGLRK